MSNRPSKKKSHSVQARGGAKKSEANRTPWIIAAVVAGIAMILFASILVVRSRGSAEPVLDAQATKGLALTKEKGCISCHSANGDRSEGPTWKGIYGQSVKLTDGTTVTVDDAYITKSIREPGSQIVDGFPPTRVMGAMPTTPMTDEQIAAVTAYIKALA